MSLVFPVFGRPFMQNQFPSNGFSQPMYRATKQKRSNRKRKWNEANEDNDKELSLKDIDHDSAYLNVIKPSTKRRRTNPMIDNANRTILEPELEENIYCNPLFSVSKEPQNNTNNANNNNSRNEDQNRSQSPYIHLVHPYLRNKSLSLSPQKSHKPEALHLNGFKLQNKQNESVTDWKNSIESQLNDARKQASHIEEICQRINNSHGLGRDVLLAKLRKELHNETFMKICERMNINPYTR